MAGLPGTSSGFVGLSETEVRQLQELITTLESGSEIDDSELHLDDDDFSDEDSNFAATSSTQTRETRGNTQTRRQKTTPQSFDWTSDTPFIPTVHEFSDVQSGFNGNVTEESQIIDYFKLFFSEDLMEKIVIETNRYYNYICENTEISPQSRLTKWVETNVNELYLFIGVSLLISRNDKLKLNDCWSNDPLLETKIFGKTMSRDRYLLLLRLLHFCNNEEQVRGERLYKIEMVLEHLKTKFSTLFYPFQNLCIDESLMLFKGRLSFKQYIRSKRHRFGVKFFVICDVETNYVLDFIIYTGSDTKLVETDADIGISGSVVNTLMQSYLEKGHSLYIDNWYTSPLLAQYLHSKNTNVCGTVNPKRRGMPEFPKKLNRGDVVRQHTDNILTLKWHDRRDVHMLTTCHEDGIVETTKRGDIVKKPVCVQQYNLNMGSVDKVDMLLSSTECLRKTIKWYKKVFFHLLDLTVVNAHAMYKVKTGNSTTLANFQLELVRELLDNYGAVNERRSRGRPSGDIPNRVIPQIFRHFPQLLPTLPGGKKYPQKTCFVVLFFVSFFMYYGTSMFKA